MLDINRVALDLNLPGVHQDWGLVNADSERTTEFLIYATKNLSEMNAESKAAVLDLVFSSIEQDEGINLFDETTYARLREMINAAKDDIETLRYWLSHFSACRDYKYSDFLNGLIQAELDSIGSREP